MSTKRNTELMYGFSNTGNLIITNGDLYVPFLEGSNPERGWTLNLPLEEYTPCDEEQKQNLGIDKITDWKEL